MKKQGKDRILHSLTILLVCFSIFALRQLFDEISLYRVEEALCLEDKTLAIRVDPSLREYFVKNHFIYYQGKKIIYELASEEEKNVIVLYTDKAICQDNTISIAIYTEKKPIFTILKDIWRKDEKLERK